MSKFAHKIKNKLNSIIEYMSQNVDKFTKAPKSDFTRKRKLPFSTTVKIVLSMGGNSISSELLEYFDYSIDTATASAFVQQRNKISSAALPFLFRKFTDSADTLKTYRGYRLLAADGSTINICTDPNDSEIYLQNKPNRTGFNQLHLNVLYDLHNKLYTDAVIQPKRKMNETRALTDIIDESSYSQNTMIIADRGYESYNVFAHIEQKGYKYAIRVKDVNSSNSMLKSLVLPETNEFDVEICINLTRKQTNEVKANPAFYKIIYPSNVFDYLELKSKAIYPMTFRVVRFAIDDGKYETIITNLDKSEFAPPDIKKLYQMRWGVETSFRELKYSIGLSHLHAKKREFSEQEIFARMIMYNFCEMIISQVIITQKSTKHIYQVNFTMAIQVCKLLFRHRGKSPPDAEGLIQKYILPVRENRIYVRNIAMKPFVYFTYRVA